MRQDTLSVSTVSVHSDTVVSRPEGQDTLFAGTTVGYNLAADTPAAARFIATDSIAQDVDTQSAQADSTSVSLDSIPLFYENVGKLDSLLARDSLLFSGTQSYDGHGVGMSAQVLPPALFRNDGVNIALLSCFLLTMLFLAHSRQQLKRRVKAFFMPLQQSSSTFYGKGDTFEVVHLLLGCQLSLICSLLFYSYACDHLSASLITLSPLFLLGVYAGVVMLVLVVKQRLYHFVHATFFSTFQRRQWYESFSLLFIFESLILFPLALLSVYFDLALEKVAMALAGLLLFVKILLFFKAFRVFFGKITGCLHLILYFCALEVLPMLLTWAILVELTRLFTTIF